MQNQIYLDHAGTTIYSSLLLDRIHNQLYTTLIANPHSMSLASKDSTTMVDHARNKVLDLFQANPLDYDVIFTLNATHSAKIVGSLLADSSKSFDYYYNINCHTSLIGLRQLATHYSTFDAIKDFHPPEFADSHNVLVSWPGQSNFNGQRFPMLNWVKFFSIRFPGCYTLFDAASLSTTSPPDLHDVKNSPDFVICSFYKIFGLPDIGGLLIKKSTANKLVANRRYFGGGTVDALAIDEPYCKKNHQIHTSLEDGTIPIHSIQELSLAIDAHLELYGSFDNVRHYTQSLRNYAIDKLHQLKFPKTDKPMVTIYEDKTQRHGPIIALSLLDECGNYIGYHNFEKLASLHNISVRTGTLCNIGGIQKYLHRTKDQIERDYNRGHKCGDAMDIIDGKPTGVIRISFGAMTLQSEIDQFVDFIKEFLQGKNKETTNMIKSTEIIQMMVYPIKSCPGYAIPEGTKWKVSEAGLEFDRSLVIIDLLTGSPVSLKKNGNMAFIRPTIDTETNSIVIENDKTHDSITLTADLHEFELKEINGYSVVTNERIMVFFSNILGLSCSIGKSMANKQMQNKSAFLLVNLTSLTTLTQDKALINRFRANIVIESGAPFIEDKLDLIKDEETGLVLSKRCKCNRCFMVAMNTKGKRDPALLLKLAKKRNENGKVCFGVNMDVEDEGDGTISVGDRFDIPN